MKNQTSLINRTRVKRIALTIANDKHKASAEVPDEKVDANGRVWKMARSNQLMSGKKFTQVSQELLEELDGTVRQLILDRISKTHQSGKTVR